MINMIYWDIMGMYLLLAVFVGWPFETLIEKEEPGSTQNFIAFVIPSGKLT